jgi:hypothetical protein
VGADVAAGVVAAEAGTTTAASVCSGDTGAAETVPTIFIIACARDANAAESRCAAARLFRCGECFAIGGVGAGRSRAFARAGVKIGCASRIARGFFWIAFNAENFIVGCRAI